MSRPLSALDARHRRSSRTGGAGRLAITTSLPLASRHRLAESNRLRAQLESIQADLTSVP